MRRSRSIFPIALIFLATAATSVVGADNCDPNPNAATCILKFNLSAVKVSAAPSGEDRRTIDTNKIKVPVAIEAVQGVMLAFTVDGERVWVSSAFVQTNRTTRLSMPNAPPGSRREGGARLADDDEPK